MSWRKAYQKNLPELYLTLVRNYQLQKFKLNIVYPRPEQLQSLEDYQYYNNLFLKALAYPEYHYLYRPQSRQNKE